MNAAFESMRGAVQPWQCDASGRMTAQFHMAMFNLATFHFLSMLARPEQDHGRLGWSAVRHAIDYEREIRSGALIVVTSALARLGTKSLTYVQRMRDARTGEQHARMEAIAARLDLVERRAVPLSDALKANAARFLAGAAPAPRRPLRARQSDAG